MWETVWTGVRRVRDSGNAGPMKCIEVRNDGSPIP
jgi:hypothetical protein